MVVPVDKPADWVNQMAVATKKDGSLRICTDTWSVNLTLKREHYQLPILEDILLDLTRAKVLVKLTSVMATGTASLKKVLLSWLTAFPATFGKYR